TNEEDEDDRAANPRDQVEAFFVEHAVDERRHHPWDEGGRACDREQAADGGDIEPDIVARIFRQYALEHGEDVASQGLECSLFVFYRQTVLPGHAFSALGYALSHRLMQSAIRRPSDSGSGTHPVPSLRLD